MKFECNLSPKRTLISCLKSSFPQSIGFPVNPFHPLRFSKTSATNMLLFNLFSLMTNLVERILICNLFRHGVAQEAHVGNKSPYSGIDHKFTSLLNCWIVNDNPFELIHVA